MSKPKTALEWVELHKELNNEMKRRQEQAAQEIWEEYIPALRYASGELVKARAAEREAKAAEGTPSDQISKPIDKSGCAK